MKLRTTVAALGLSLSLGCSGTFAQGVPTLDTKGLLEDMKQYQQQLKDYGIQNEQLDNMIKQVEQLEEQIAQFEEMIAALTDPSQVMAMIMGGELDGLLEGKFDGDVIEAIANGARGDWSGLASSSRMQDAINTALASGGTSQSEVSAMATSGNENAERNATATSMSAATSAAAEAAIEEAEQIKQRASLLVEKIPQLTSVKESMDHNTRVTAELAIALAALLQVESVQTMHDGMGGVVDAATVAEAMKYLDHTLPE